MKKYGAILGGAVILSTIVFSVGAWGINQTPGSDDGSVIISPEIRSLGALVAAKARPARDGDIAAAADDDIMVWAFFPQDGPTTATVVILCNLNEKAVEVPFFVDGSDGPRDLTMTLQKNELKRICSDNVSSPGWSWKDFGTGANLCLVGLPAGVLMDAYLVWNGASDAYDPGAAMHRMPARLF